MSLDADRQARRDWHREHPASDPPGYDPHPDDFAPSRPQPRCASGCDDPWCVDCSRRADSQQTQGDSR